MLFITVSLKVLLNTFLSLVYGEWKVPAAVKPVGKGNVFEVKQRKAVCASTDKSVGLCL